MSEYYFPFDEVLVMDRMALTGLALCDIADSVAGRPCSIHISHMEALRTHLIHAAGKRVLIITELVSDQDKLSEGLELLSMLRLLRYGGRHRVMVCTGFTDPLLLKVIVSRQPSVIALRQEPISVLTQAIRMAGVSWPDSVLSPAVTAGLALARDVKLTPRELEWLVTQVDGMGLRESAKVMKVNYKTVATFRRNIAQRFGIQSPKAFTWQLAQLQDNMITGDSPLQAAILKDGIS